MMLQMIENRPQRTLAEQYGAALDWWRDAGVDCDFVDDVEPWLTEPETDKVKPNSVSAKKKAEAAPEPAVLEKHLPADLAAFREWWISPENPFVTGPGPRVPPRGEPGAKLMLLVPMPETTDSDTLLSGSQGRMLESICHALGVATDDCYFASALPGYMTLPDWDALCTDGLGTAVRHHVGLAAPERLLVFGSKLPALFDHDKAAPPEEFAGYNNVPALTTFAPERLIDHPRQRARLWQRLLQWTA